MSLLSMRKFAPSRFLFLAGLPLTLLFVSTGVASAQEGGGAAPERAQEPLILFMIKSLGWIFGPMLLAISVGMVALVVLLILDLRMTSAIPPGFVDEFTDTVNKRKFKEAFDLARNDPSFLGRVLTAGMSRLQ